jgi:hypothetical protein
MVSLSRTGARTEGRSSSYQLSERSLAGIRAYERRTRRNEVVHLVALLPAALGLLAGGLGSGLLFALFLVVLAVNLHPFILQRYNRVRIHRALARRPPAQREPG